MSRWECRVAPSARRGGRPSSAYLPLLRNLLEVWAEGLVCFVRVTYFLSSVLGQGLAPREIVPICRLLMKFSSLPSGLESGPPVASAHFLGCVTAGGPISCGPHAFIFQGHLTLFHVRLETVMPCPSLPFNVRSVSGNFQVYKS